jgi:hypothetical protein
MRIDELKPGMVVRRSYDWAPEEFPAGSKVVYQVPDTLTFEHHKQGYSSYNRKTVRVPVLNMYVISFTDHDDADLSVSTTIVLTGTKAIAGRELHPVADTLSEAMASLGRGRQIEREHERKRLDVSQRCYNAHDAIAALVPTHRPTFRDWRGERQYPLRNVELPLEVIEELIAMAQLYDDSKEG